MAKENHYGFGKVGVLFGGDSAERDISIKSGKAIYKALKNAGLKVEPICLGSVNKRSLRNCKIDFAFIALHGKGGEDGKIQDILDSMNVPYVGSCSKGSRRAFNKEEAKKAFSRNSIPTPKWKVVNRRNWRKKILGLTFPVFVKPLEDGSSIGVSLVKNFDDLCKALPKILERNAMVIIEEKIYGRELTVGILGSKALPVIELVTKRPFYDFKAKYTKGFTEYILPAKLSRNVYNNAQNIALKAHKALGLRDFSRVDLFLDRQDVIHVLEVNTIPGFTETSLMPKAAGKVSLDFTQLCLKIMSLAKERINKDGKKKKKKKASQKNKTV